MDKLKGIGIIQMYMNPILKNGMNLIQQKRHQRTKMIQMAIIQSYVTRRYGENGLF